jgi:ABC-type phosphonate transport system ATPase subunit
MAAPLLEIDRLSVRFGAATVVDDVSFSVAAGEVRAGRRIGLRKVDHGAVGAAAGRRCQRQPRAIR